MITKQELVNFKPTEEMIRATELVFLCMAAVDTIKPIVQQIQQSVLDKYKFKVDPKNKRICDDGEDIITKLGHDYLMSDDDFKVYHKECRKLEDEKNLKVDNPEFCPLLVAENDLIQAQHLLIDCFGPMFGIKSTDLWGDHREKFLDLTLRLMAKYIDTKQVLARLQNGN